MLRVLQISRINFDSGRTHVYNLTKTGEALNGQDNISFSLISTQTDKGLAQYFDKHRVKERFSVAALSCYSHKLVEKGGKFWNALALLLSNLSTIKYLLKEKTNFDLVYLRDETLFLAALFAKFALGKKLVYEVHSVLTRAHGQMMNVSLARHSDGVVAISKALKDYYSKYNDKILYSLCSSAEDELYSDNKTKADLRQELGLPKDKFIVGYVGVLGPNPNGDVYEVDDIVQALKGLPEEVLFVCVGEMNSNADWLREIARKEAVEDKLLILPWQERASVPKFLQAFDINLIPKRRQDYVGDSPAKMFPALRAARPIIAGKADSILEVLEDEVNSLIVKSNEPEAWRSSIKRLMEDGELAGKISSRARGDSAKYSWESRGRNIGDFLSAL